MAFCVSCGQSLHDSMRFCRFCGNQQPSEQLIQRLRLEAQQIRQIAMMMSNQQAMQQADIASLLQAGGVQRALGQQALDAQRQTDLSRAYEPYQRLEFLKGIMTNMPTSQSAVTATTAPGSNPLAQAAGTGIGAYAAYNIANRGR